MGNPLGFGDRFHGCGDLAQGLQGPGSGVVDEFVGAVAVLVHPGIVALGQEIGLVRRGVVARAVTDVVGQHRHEIGILGQRPQRHDGQYPARRRGGDVIDERGQLPHHPGDEQELLGGHLENPHRLTRHHRSRVDRRRVAVIIDERGGPALGGAEPVEGVDLRHQCGRRGVESLGRRIQCQVRDSSAGEKKVDGDGHTFQPGVRVEARGQHARHDAAVLVARTAAGARWLVGLGKQGEQEGGKQEQS